MELNGKAIEGTEHKPELATLPRQPSFTAVQSRKAVSILDACKWKDTDTLRALASSEGGLLSDELRRQAC
jgi:TBC1 domain family member 20